MNSLVIIFFLVVLLVSLILVILLSRKQPRRVYKPKGQYLLSAGEKRFFDALSNSIPSYIYICPKVRIADLVETTLQPTDPNYWRSVAPMNQKHVDFVLVNRSDFAPRCIIELDGGSHTEKERLKRDTFVNAVFASAGIPILHIPVKSVYPYQDLRETIENALQAHLKKD